MEIIDSKIVSYYVTVPQWGLQNIIFYAQVDCTSSISKIYWLVMIFDIIIWCSDSDQTSAVLVADRFEDTIYTVIYNSLISVCWSKRAD